MSKQIGGDHYAKKIQPWDIIDEYGLDFYAGNVVKYVLRYKNKGGEQDLKKAIHYLEKLIDKEYYSVPKLDRTPIDDDEWIPHDGSGFPDGVDENTLVDAEFSDGDIMFGRYWQHSWTIEGDGFYITKWRPAK